MLSVFFGRQQVVASLFDQLVCYWYFLWTTTSDSFFIWAVCVLSVFSLDDKKWQFSLFEQPSYYLSINEYISENLAEKSVTNLYLQKSVISYPRFVTLCLPPTLSYELTVLGSIICYGLCKMFFLLGLEVVFPRFYSLSGVCRLKSIACLPSNV